MLKHNKYIHPVAAISFTSHNAYTIEASAGTGKTWTIERLFIKALMERSELSLKQILVVTFTNAATQELKARILQQLKTTISWLVELRLNPEFNVADLFFSQFLSKRSDTLDKDIALLMRAMQNFDTAAIFTIHGFCNSLLQRYPVECNFDNRFELTDTKQELIRQLVTNFMRQEIINNPRFKVVIDKVYHTLNLVLATDYETGIVERIIEKLPNDLFVFKNGGYFPRYTILTKPNLDLLINLNGEVTDKTLILEHLLSSVVNYVARHYVAANAHYGKISYDELIEIVADSVAHNTGFANAIATDFPIVFIDEFQDTDYLQWQIFNTVYKLDQKNKSGIVIVVGDPKQAIYRFRGADIDVYVAAKNIINNNLVLLENRRSHPQIMNFINQLFSPLHNPNCFVEGLDYMNIVAKIDENSLLNLPTHSELDAISKNYQLKEQFYTEPVQIVTLTGKNKAEKDVNLLNALTLEILTLLKVNPGLVGRIAILVVKHTQAKELVQHFKQYGIKASELKLGSIFATSTADDLYKILYAVLELANRKLFLNAITTSLFNLSMNDLFNWEDNASEEFINLQQKFFHYKQVWETDGVISLIYNLISDTILLNQEAHHGITNRELSNLLQLGELLNKYSLQTDNPLEVLHWFKGKIKAAQSGVETDMDGSSEELVRLDNDDEQIIITTQHKSKGLEYDILFCPYFKPDSVINGPFDFAYQMPFFAKYRDKDNLFQARLINNLRDGNFVVEKDNKEIQCLNYVALTRAKARIYIYLKQPTLTKYGKYHPANRPDKIASLFGYIKNNPLAMEHPLFNYPNLFAPDKLTMKSPELLPGVAVYLRNNLDPCQIVKLKLEIRQNNLNQISFKRISLDAKLSQVIYRQSYSRLTHATENVTEYYVPDERPPIVKVKYIYPVLNELSGAKFGILVHSLCESYPLNLAKTKEILLTHNTDLIYSNDLLQIIHTIFKHKLTPGGLSLANLTGLCHELAFNLTVTESDIANKIGDLLAKYFGAKHPYTIACRSLTRIYNGFLNGFIDLLFCYEGKYYILDYKTNTLADYASTSSPDDINNPLVIANADNHYYLQYLLYLVAVKRYLQTRLQIDDATHLLGGAVYYYIRGLFVVDCDSGGVYFDTKCQNLVHELDLLLNGDI